MYWIEIKEFNVMSLFKKFKDKREEKVLAILKVEGREWVIKIVKIGGKKTCLVLK